MVTETEVVRAIGDISCAIIAIVVDIFVNLIPVPAERGFVCQDPSIRYNTPTQNQINSYTLFIVFVLLPLVILIIWEISDGWSDEDTTHLTSCGRGCQAAIVFIFSICISHTIGVLISLIVGRLRPDFMDVCRPDVDCRDTRVHYVYIEQYKCMGNKDEVKISRMSFPSISAIISSQSMVYLCLLVEAKMKNPSTFLIKRFLQVIFICGFLCVCFFVIVENRNHPSDVLAGVIFGTLFAFYTAFFMTNWFRKSNIIDDNDSELDEGRRSSHV